MKNIMLAPKKKAHILLKDDDDDDDDSQKLIIICQKLLCQTANPKHHHKMWKEDAFKATKTTRKSRPLNYTMIHNGFFIQCIYAIYHGCIEMYSFL